MPILIEPTAIMAESLKRLSPTEAEIVWACMECSNQELQKLLEKYGASPLQALDRKQAFRVFTSHVCAIHRVEPELLRSPYRFQRLVNARSQLAVLLIELLDAIHVEVAQTVGRERSSVSHMVQNHHDMMKFNEVYRSQYQRLEAMCRTSIFPSNEEEKGVEKPDTVKA